MIRNKITVLLCGAILLVSFSCSHYSKLVEVSNDNPKPAPRVWLVKSISLEERVPDRDVEKKIPEMLALLGDKYNIKVVLEKSELPADKPYALLSLWIKEQSYNRSLDQYNSIAALLTLTAPDSVEILARAFYSEESEESIKSFQRLYLVLDDLYKALLPRLVNE
jgi:hypothetical protein